ARPGNHQSAPRRQGNGDAWRNLGRSQETRRRQLRRHRQTARRRRRRESIRIFVGRKDSGRNQDTDAARIDGVLGVHVRATVDRGQTPYNSEGTRMMWNVAIKWIMLVSGVLTFTMVYAAI